MPIPNEILDFLSRGESETLEFKAVVREPTILARLIASFANAKGGTIVIGVKEPPEVVGVNEPQLRKIYEAALRLLEPTSIQSTLTFLDANGLKIGLVQIAPSSELVLTQGSAYVRTGAMTQPMAWTQMRERLPPKPPEVTLESLMRASEQQTVHLEKLSKDNEELKTELKKANDPIAKRKERALGFIYGVGASLVAAILWLLATRQWLWLT